MPCFCSDRREGLLRHREHAARAASAVVEQVGAGLDLGLDGQKHEVRHQSNGVTRRPVLARFLVVLFVELPDQFLEDRSHGWLSMPAGERSISGSRNLLISVPMRIGLGKCGELIAELEILEDVLDVGREAVEVVLEIGKQLLLAAAGLQIAQRELRRIVEGLSGSVA